MGSLPWGAKPLRDFLYLGTLRVEIKLRIYLILLIFRGVRLKAYLYFGSLFEREIIQKLNSKLIKNLFGSTGGALYWESLFEREIFQKSDSKSLRFALNSLGVRLRHTWAGSALAGRNLSKSIQNQTESLGEAPSGLLISRHAARGNYSKLFSKLFKNISDKSAFYVNNQGKSCF